jgi:hypothetical protein
VSVQPRTVFLLAAAVAAAAALTVPSLLSALFFALLSALFVLEAWACHKQP